MAILFEGDVSDTGVATFSATRVNYVLAATTTAGVSPKPRSARDDDYVVQLGWFTFGVEVTIPDVLTAVFWREPTWINMLNMEYSAIPQTDASANDFGIWADRVRWSLPLGTVVHLLVVGV